MAIFFAAAECELCFCELFRRVAAGAHAVGNADTPVGVACKRDAGQLLPQAFDAIETIEMSDAVLRHGRLPLVDARKQRLLSQAGDLRTQDLLQFVAHDSNDLLIGKRPHIFRVPSREKATQQGAVVGSAMRKLVVHKSRG